VNELGLVEFQKKNCENEIELNQLNLIGFSPEFDQNRPMNTPTFISIYLRSE